MAVEDDVGLLQKGLTICAGEVTLATGATTTTVSAYYASAGSHINLEPTNAAMAAEWITTRPYVKSADKTKSQFIITHANAGTTRTLSYSYVTRITS